jgi:phage tail-like protein
MPNPGSPPAFGMAFRFQVEADGLDLGLWSSCKGLDIKADLKKFHDPGNYSYERILFADIKYEAVKLERAMEKKASAAVRSWLETWWHPWAQPGFNPLGEGYEFGSSMTIRLLDSQWREVSTWTLRNAYPSAWAGPQLSATDSKVALERLEIAHEGFLDLQGIPGL